MEFQYKHAACGGTFDLLHKGHKKFLLTVFKSTKFSSIGLTTDEMNKNLNKPTFQNQNQRKKELKRFLKSNNLDKRSKIIHLANIYGTTLSDKTIEALVISKQTLNGAKAINYTRIKKGLSQLPIIICPQVLAQDKKIISSSRIRDGIIDRNGQSYLMFLNNIADKTLTGKTRKKIKSPLGPLVKITPIHALKNPPFVAVGDMTVLTFLENKIVPRISIIDLYVNRQKKYASSAQLGFKKNNVDFTLRNPPGTITSRLVEIMRKAINNNKQKLVIRIIGEEDLAAIPAIVLCPLGSSIYYGQPDKGTIMVEITEKIKKDICSIMQT